MILLDAYPLVALVAGGAAEHDVRRLIHAGSCAIPTLNLAEVFDVLERTRNVPQDRARGAIDPLLDGHVATILLSLEIARGAARIRARHYHRRSRPLSLADCVLLASGASGDGVATADPDVLAVAPLVDLEPIALPSES